MMKLELVIALEVIEKGEGGASSVTTGRAALEADPPLFVAMTITL